MAISPDNFNFDFDFDGIGQYILIAFAIVFSIILLFLLAHYIMRSIALMRVARRRGIAHAWLIWIPIARNWALGAIVDDYDRRSGNDRHFRLILLLGSAIMALAAISICAGFVSFIPIIENLSLHDPAPALMSLSQKIIELSSKAQLLQLLTIVMYSLHLICLYKIFESLSPKLCILFFVLSILIPLFEPICLLCLRNKGYPQTTYLPDPGFGPEDWYKQ